MKVQSDSHDDGPTSQHLAHGSRANPPRTGYFAASVPLFSHSRDASFSSELDERTPDGVFVLAGPELRVVIRRAHVVSQSWGWLRDCSLTKKHPKE